MKNKLLICFLFLFFLSKSQVQRFIYEYKYVADSTKIDSFSTDIMRLDIFKDHSESLSDSRAKRDSAIFNVDLNRKEISTHLLNNEEKMKIFKSNESFYTANIENEQFKIYFDKLSDWKIEKEFKIIEGYECQKATIQLNGRKWIAWFTQQIPIKDGPYMFANLPGLIINIHDVNNYFRFNLTAKFMIDNSSPNISYIERKKIPKISREQYSKKWKKFQAYPIGFREQMAQMNPKFYDDHGHLVNTEQLYKADREKLIKLLAKKNNHIDKNLYK